MEILSINVTQSYLEMARYWTNQIEPETEMTPTAMYAISAHTYVFSYMAVNSFVSMGLAHLWEDPASSIRLKYKGQENIADLLGPRGELRELTAALNELSAGLGIAPIHTANNQLWMNFTQIVYTARNYYIHPKPGSKFDEHMEMVLQRAGRRTDGDWWLFPVKVAEDILQHFYLETGTDPPTWLNRNQELTK